jgi:hypothetical protein
MARSWIAYLLSLRRGGLIVPEVLFRDSVEKQVMMRIVCTGTIVHRLLPPQPETREILLTSLSRLPVLLQL